MGMIKTVIPQKKSISIDGRALSYRAWGIENHHCLLLLHGFLGNGRIWGDFASELCQHYYILALDQRGHGDSDWADDGAYGIDDHFVDLVGITDQLGLKELILIGHSMGGRNALLFAACCPEKIKGLILVDTRPANSADAVSSLRNMIEKVKRTARIMPKHGLNNSGAVYPFDPRLITGAESANYRVESLWPLMASVTCSTLIIRGENSTFLSRKEAEKMNQSISRSKLTEIPGTSHNPMIEEPVIFRAHILSFLNEIVPPSNRKITLKKELT